MNALENDLSVLSPAARARLAGPARLFIDGRYVESSAQSTLEVIDPSSGGGVARVPESDAQDVDAAVKSARAAVDGGAWSKLRPYQRAGLMMALADAIEANGEGISQVEAVNSGRLVGATRGLDVHFSAHVLRMMAGWATRIEGRTFDLSVPYLPDQSFFACTLMQPVGVVAGIVPWNVPLAIATWKVAAAFAAGCAIVVKPAPQTPLTALWMAELATQVGFPAGALNVVTGSSAGAMLVEHPGVNKISFTGSTAVGREISSNAGRSFKRCTLELGGKSPVVIFPDADLDQAIAGAAWAIFGNHGQNCCAGSRLYVHESIHDKVVDGIARIAQSIRLGPGLDPQSQMGPLVSKRQLERALGYVEAGRRDGATVVVGGKPLTSTGFYMEPTVLTDVRPDMSVVREEIFAPVLVARRFGNEADVLREANDNEYGLGASVWTSDINRAHRFIEGFKAGTVWVNTHNILDAVLPFGGVKNSGMGHDLGEEAIRENLQMKSTVIRRG